MFIVAGVVAAAFFSLAEMVLISISGLRLRFWVREKLVGTRWVTDDTLEQPYRLLSPILVGHTLAVTVTAMVTAGTLATGYGQVAVAPLMLTVLTVIVLVPPLYLFGEIIPRVIARARSHQLFSAVSIILRLCSWVFRPVIVAADRLSGWVLQRLGSGPAVSAEISRRNLENLLIESERVGVVEPAEREIIAGVFAFGQTAVKAVMTPVEAMVTAPAGARVGEIGKIISSTGFSRIPLHGRSPDHIVGMVHVFDLFKQEANNRPRSRSVVFTRPETPCDDLLVEMKRRRCHLAVVVEGGRVHGMVTMEDLVEELVGEIRDEHDIRVESLMRSPGAFIVDAHLPIAEINEKHGLDLPTDGAETVAGFVIAQLGRIPDIGEEFRYRGWKIDILDATPQRVRKVRFLK